MNAKYLIATSIAALAATSAMAGDVAEPAAAAAPLTRAQVKAEVIQARKAGELIPAGELYPIPPVSPGDSNVTRAEVRTQVLQARAAGELIPAGEGPIVDTGALAGTSTLSRAEVKAEVIAARKAGELIPAGEGVPDPYVRHTPVDSGTLGQTLAKLFRRRGNAAL